MTRIELICRVIKLSSPSLIDDVVATAKRGHRTAAVGFLLDDHDYWLSREDANKFVDWVESEIKLSA